MTPGWTKWCRRLNRSSALLAQPYTLFTACATRLSTLDPWDQLLYGPIREALDRHRKVAGSWAVPCQVLWHFESSDRTLHFATYIHIP